MTAGLRPYLLLAGLGLLFFAALVLHPTQVLYSDHSDLLALHLPAKHFLVREWQQTGELPLWCPYRFAGVPFVHDIQVGIFYPPYWPLFLLPPEWIGVSLSWLLVAHLIATGWFMYAYARSQGFGSVGALVAAIGWMFSGKWMLHLLAAGHTITIGLTWLPLVLLLLERAIQRHNLLWATAAGMAFALLTLGTHPQWTFYAGLFVALWTLAPALQQAGYLGEDGERSARRTLASLGRWLGLGAWTVVVAAGLSAVQLLPTLEAAEHSIRGAGVGAGRILQLGLLSLASLIGPAVTTTPPYPPELMWEERGGLTVLWAAGAASAYFLGGPARRYQALVCLGLVLFAIGGAVLLHWLPGFGLFRQPSRILLIAALPVAFLAGSTVDALLHDPAPSPEALGRCRHVLTRVLALTVILAGGFALRVWLAPWLETGTPGTVRFHVYWFTLLLSVPAMYWLLRSASQARPPDRSSSEGAETPRSSRLSLRARRLIWVGLLLVDLWALSWPLVAVRNESTLFAPSDSVLFLQANTAKHDRVLDRDAPGSDGGTPLGSGAPMALLYSIEAVRGYTPLDVLRFKEYLCFIGDSDRPLRAFEQTPGFEQTLTFPVIGNFPIENRALLDLLGTRYLLQGRGPAASEYLPLLTVAPSAGFPGTIPWGAVLMSSDEQLLPSQRLLEARGWQKVYTDPKPHAYDFHTGGVRQLSPFDIYESPTVLPRAFMVPLAVPLPEGAELLPALKTTDFRRQVLLEDWHAAAGPGLPAGGWHRARIRSYACNRVAIDVEGNAPGFLVLTDVWFPGWTCTVDGKPVRLYRGNYLFRAVAVPAGTHEVVFTFQPSSYRWGRRLSLVTAVGALVVLGVGATIARRGHCRGRIT